MISFQFKKTFLNATEPVEMNFAGSAQSGEIVALHGASGVGKTTLLKMLAGIVLPEAGQLSVSDVCWFDSSRKLNLLTRHRDLGFVFQDYALFPNMTVYENLEYGMGNDRDTAFTERIIEISQIQNLLQRKPEQLSGGQQQRVALARAVMRKPKLLLMDEPLSALDGVLRSVLQDELLALRELLDITIVFTSHSIPEVFKLADKVMVIESGQIVRQGPPAEVFAEGDQTVQGVGEYLSTQTVNGKRTITVLVDGKIVQVPITQT